MNIAHFTSLLACVLLTSATPTHGVNPNDLLPCAGDCNDDETVSVDELVRAVTIALGAAATDVCLAIDNNNDGFATVDELVRSVGNALDDHVDCKSLRRAAADVGLWIGVAEQASALPDASYRRVLRQFSSATPENELKQGVVQAVRGEDSYEQADAIIVPRCEAGDSVRGHTLVWDQQLPSWVLLSTIDERSRIMQEFIASAMSRYPCINTWDVVNEAFDERGRVKQNIWTDALGDEYLTLAFDIAHGVNPDALLFYNDFALEHLGPKWEGILNWIRKSRAEGVPISGIGTQMHLTLGDTQAPAALRTLCRDASAEGLLVHVTELDVRLRAPVTAEALSEQARLFRDVVTACADEPNCRSVTIWGAADHFSWISGFFPGYTSGTLFDDSFVPKPAFDLIRKALRERANPR